MEEILNKVKFTFSTAASNAASIASQVQQYLPGNPIYREYDVTVQVSSAGRGLLWKVYEGYRKSNKEEVSLFIFEKKQIDKIGKADKENVLNLLRKGVSQLTRLRHPQILTVQHPLEESRELLAFATEPVFASLANILGDHSNLITPLPPGLQDYSLHDVEMKYGVLQLSEGLAFIHDSVKMIHRCLTPENVIVNKQGAWKLFGFDFCVPNAGTPEEPIWPFEDYDSSLAEHLQPDLDYMAPEYVASRTMDPKVDIFCLGICVYALYNCGKPLHQNYNDFPSYRKRAVSLEKATNIELPNIPADLKPHLKGLLQFKSSERPVASQFCKIAYFNDVAVNTLRYLDKIFQWDNLQKSQFYKKLPAIIPHLPHRMAILRVIPSLNKECVNPTMIPFVLPVMLQMAQSATKDEFVNHILPYLKPIMKISEPIQVMLLLLQKMELLLSKTPNEAIESDILPFVFRAIECNTQQIQELCLTCVPMCVAHCLQSKVRQEFLPRIRKLCLQTDYLSIRVNCLICIGKIIQHVEKWAIPEDVLGFLCQVPSKESAVVMAIVGIYQIAFQHRNLGISKEVLGNKVIPALMPLSIENSLSVSQHSTIMTLIREMIAKMEEEHRKKLMQLEEVQIEQESLKIQIPSMGPPNDMSDFFPDMAETHLGSSTSLGNLAGAVTNANQNARLQQNSSPSLSKSSSLCANLTSQVEKKQVKSDISPVIPQKGLAAPRKTQDISGIDPWSNMNFNMKPPLSNSITHNVPQLSNTLNGQTHSVRPPQQASSFQPNFGIIKNNQPFTNLFPANVGNTMSYTGQSINSPQENQCKSLSAAEINEFLQ